eukprot:COSAG05_NODE_2284_length_3284_cov_22.607535_5_plen_71_part_00
MKTLHSEAGTEALRRFRDGLFLCPKNGLAQLRGWISKKIQEPDLNTLGQFLVIMGVLRTAETVNFVIVFQ